MKTKVLIFITSLILSNLYAQKTELRVSLNSGLFSFSGQSAERTSQLNIYNQSNSGYTNNPYGSKNGLCYGFSLNLKRITKQNTIYGLDFGYETLRSKISINIVSGDFVSIFMGNPIPMGGKVASGETFLNSNLLNLNPFVGHRFNSKKFPIDLVGGFDIGYVLSSKEIGNATAVDGTKYSSSVGRKTINIDFRPRIQVSTDYKKIGLYLGYSLGLVNYKSGYVGGTNEAFSKLIRFGITYKIIDNK
jgi:hypothetical protein